MHFFNVLYSAYVHFFNVLYGEYVRLFKKITFYAIICKKLSSLVANSEVIKTERIHKKVIKKRPFHLFTCQYFRFTNVPSDVNVHIPGRGIRRTDLWINAGIAWKQEKRKDQRKNTRLF